MNWNSLHLVCDPKRSSKVGIVAYILNRPQSGTFRHAPTFGRSGDPSVVQTFPSLDWSTAYRLSVWPIRLFVYKFNDRFVRQNSWSTSSTFGDNVFENIRYFIVQFWLFYNFEIKKYNLELLTAWNLSNPWPIQTKLLHFWSTNCAMQHISKHRYVYCYTYMLF